MTIGKFAAALTCMDGRPMQAIIDWAKKERGADFVDMITAAGMDKVLATKKPEQYKKMLRISIKHHRAKTVLIVGHQDCAGNPVKQEQHEKDIKKAKKVAEKWLKDFEAKIPVFGLYVEEKNGKWQVAKII